MRVVFSFDPRVQWPFSEFDLLVQQQRRRRRRWHRDGRPRSQRVVVRGFFSSSHVWPYGAKPLNIQRTPMTSFARARARERNHCRKKREIHAVFATNDEFYRATRRAEQYVWIFFNVSGRLSVTRNALLLADGRVHSAAVSECIAFIQVIETAADKNL